MVQHRIDHAEDHAEDHHHSDADTHCSNDVELAVEDLIDGFRAGLREANETHSKQQFSR